MKKSLIPTFKSGNLYTVNPNDIYERGYRYLFMDLDNTFDSYKDAHPSTKAINWVNECHNKGIKIVVVSNNYKSRVSLYANELGIDDIVSFACKPFRFKLNRYMKDKNIDLKQALFIGDQVFTDVRCGNNAKIDTLLVTPLTNEDQWFSHLRRYRERPLLKKLEEKKLLKKWK